MVGQQVRRHRQQALQLGRGRRLTPEQRIDDRQPPRITQRRVQGRPPRQPALLSVH